MLQRVQEVGLELDCTTCLESFGTELARRSETNRMARLSQALDDALPEEGQPINVEQFAHVISASNTLQGAHLATSVSQSVVGKCNTYMDWLMNSADIIDDRTITNTLSDIVNICEESVSQSLLAKKLSAYASSQELHLAVMQFRGLGDTLQAQVDGLGSSYAIVTRILCAQRDVQKKLSDKEVKASLERVAQLSLAVDETVKLIDDAIRTPLESKLAELLDGVSGWAGGAAEGKVWHSDLESYTLECLLDKAKETVMKSKIADFKSSCDAIVEAKARLKSTLEFFGHDPTSFLWLIQRAEKTEATLCITHVEGLLCALYLGDETGKPLKTKTHGIQRMCKKSLKCIKWEQIHPILLERAEKATKLK